MGDVQDALLCAAAICWGTGNSFIQLLVRTSGLIFSSRLVTTPLKRQCCSINTQVSQSVTHCQRTGRSPSGVAPGWARPCAFRPEDTSPPSGLHQSAQPPNMRRPIAEGERWRPSLQDEQAGLEKSSALWTAADNTRRVSLSHEHCNADY